MRSLSRSSLLLLAGIAAAACGDDDPTAPGLSAEEVAGRYNVCALVFDPEGDVLPPVDIRARAFEASNPVTTAAVGLNADRSFELEYTPRGLNTDRELPGTFTMQSAGVDLRFANASGAAAILLPASVALTFQAQPKTLAVAQSSVYEVPRREYAQLANISESGLGDRIPGRLQARFTAGGC